MQKDSELQARGKVSPALLLAPNFPKYLGVPGHAADLETQNTTKQPQRQQKDQKKSISWCPPPGSRGMHANHKSFAAIVKTDAISHQNETGLWKPLCSKLWGLNPLLF